MPDRCGCPGEGDSLLSMLSCPFWPREQMKWIPKSGSAGTTPCDNRDNWFMSRSSCFWWPCIHFWIMHGCLREATEELHLTLGCRQSVIKAKMVSRYTKMGGSLRSVNNCSLAVPEGTTSCDNRNNIGNLPQQEKNRWIEAQSLYSGGFSLCEEK